MVPTVDDRPGLDLGAAENAGLLAWADAVLGPALDRRVPGLRHRLRVEVDHRVLTPYLGPERWPWRERQDNWNPWIRTQLA